MDHHQWKINSLIRPPVAVLDEHGQCALPQDLRHCHSAEVQHQDGIAECLAIDGGQCEAPGPGHHVRIHPCEPAMFDFYRHSCQRCIPGARWTPTC